MTQPPGEELERREPVRPGDTFPGEIHVPRVREDKPITDLAARMLCDDATVVLDGTAVCCRMPLPMHYDPWV